MAKPKTIRPSYYDDAEESSGDELTYALSSRQKEKEDDNDDELASISFGALNKAQSKILKKSSSKTNKKSKKSKKEYVSESESSDEEEGSFFESDSEDDAPRESSSKKNSRRTIQDKSRRSKHAPAESSSKRPVSKIREIPGLESSNRHSSLYKDIRFDAAYGKADLIKARKDYSFLDEYRQSEIKQMESILRDKKSHLYLSEYELDEIRQNLQSLKSRLDTLKNRDLEHDILSQHKKQQLENFRVGKQQNPYFLKRSEKRKMLQKAKFDSMKPKQREKVMERKRKKRLGKEFKQLEFKPRS
ncbi:RRP36 [[Candida] subhashii]|uniref:rRNA biogenesis protein RRP36 n=1 Tax=[Candida] subhashii TaxID=561895 RepID=A0A8J5UL75_9ASCO|nr:RRP36 [[Candida] subhashii]KAG7662626.1 RRP36 [[Candida] subhashii]